MILRRTQEPDPLDQPVLRWTEVDKYTVRDLLTSLIIVGRTGSGKSWYSGRRIAHAIIRNGNSAGLICGAKPEDRAMWEGIFAEAKRSDALRVIAENEPLRTNLLEYEARRDGHPRNITKFITTVGEGLRRSESGGSEDGKYWAAQQQRFIHNCVVIVKLATGTVNAWDLQKFAADMAQCPQQLESEEWQRGFHFQLLRQAHEKSKTPLEEHDFNLARLYFLNEMAALNDRTRSSITAGVFQILHCLNSGLLRDLIGGATNFDIDELVRRREWLLVDAPPSSYGDEGLLLNAALKYVFERATLRHVAAADDPVVCVWCDEFQQFVNSHDWHYLAQCRSHRGCLVALTQSIPSLFAALGGANGEHEATALLSNFSHKLFHALGDAESAEIASQLCGRELRTFIGGSMNPEVTIWDEFMGQSGFTGNFSEHMELIVEPAVFMNGLRTGGPSKVSDAILIRSGEPFSSGANWMRVSFESR